MEETTSTTKELEPLLTPHDSRYVMFPIVDEDIWKMYKKSVDSFWVPQECDLSRDLNDWGKLSSDEKAKNARRPSVIKKMAPMILLIKNIGLIYF